MSKYHFTLIDGTACTQSNAVTLGGKPSNIAIMASAAESDNSCTATYFAGVGTYGNSVRQSFNKIFAPVGGDIDSILKGAVADLKKAANKNKKIIVAGYSRGAALARRLACIAGVPIDLLVVLDTVASIGIPSTDMIPPASDIQFTNATLSPHVKRAFHAVALDETRAAYNPILFNEDGRVIEQWFAGVHADIGGGNYDDGLSAEVLRVCYEMISSEVGVSLHFANRHPSSYSDLRQPIIYNELLPQNRRLCCTWKNDKPTDTVGRVNVSVAHRSHLVYYLARARRPGVHKNDWSKELRP